MTTDPGMPPRPYCAVHGIHHTGGRDCKFSEDDTRLLEEYDRKAREYASQRGRITSTIEPLFPSAKQLEQLARKTAEREKRIREQSSKGH